MYARGWGLLCLPRLFFFNLELSFFYTHMCACVRASVFVCLFIYFCNKPKGNLYSVFLFYFDIILLKITTRQNVELQIKPDWHHLLFNILGIIPPLFKFILWARLDPLVNQILPAGHTFDIPDIVHHVICVHLFKFSHRSRTPSTSMHYRY